MGVVMRVWRGEFSLARQFFGFHLAGTLLYLILIRVLFSTMSQRWAGILADSQKATWLTFAFGLGLFTVLTWSLTGVWRAAARYTPWPRICARSWVFLVGGMTYAVFIVPLFL